MIGLFLSSVILEQTLAGFILALICSFGIGLGANLSHLTFFAMINYLDWHVISKFNVGAAVSGVFMVIVRMILVLIFGSAEKTSAIPSMIYFIIAITVNTVDIFMNVSFCYSDVYRTKIEPFIVKKDEDKEGVELLSDRKSLIGSESGNSEKRLEIGMKEEGKRIEKQSYFLTLQ